MPLKKDGIWSNGAELVDKYLLGYGV